MTPEQAAFLAESDQRRDYLAELIADLEQNLDAHKAAVPGHDFDAELAEMRRVFAECEAFVEERRALWVRGEGD